MCLLRLGMMVFSSTRIQFLRIVWSGDEPPTRSLRASEFMKTVQPSCWLCGTRLPRAPQLSKHPLKTGTHRLPSPSPALFIPPEMLLLLFLAHALSMNNHPVPGLVLDSRASADSCADINNCRKLFDIIWGCLATIFACSWVSVHPNVPPPDQSQLALLWGRLKMMLIADCSHRSGSDGGIRGPTVLHRLVVFKE